MKILSFFLFFEDPDPDPAAQINADPDTDTDPDPKLSCCVSEFIESGSESRSRVLMNKNWERKTTAENFCILFWSKIAIYLSLCHYIGRPSYRKSLQPSKENTQLKFFNCFLLFWFIFARLDPDLGTPLIQAAKTLYRWIFLDNDVSLWCLYNYLVNDHTVPYEASLSQTRVHSGGKFCRPPTLGTSPLNTALCSWYVRLV